MFPNAACQWIPVALSADVPEATVVPAWIPGLELALWRAASGKLAASTNRCPHRGMRLSHGFVRGENLACIYHGWSFGVEGTCVRIPAHPEMTPPATITSQNQAVAEVGGIVWVCAGQPQSTPPQFAGFDPLRTLTIDVTAAALEACSGVSERDAGKLVALVNGDEICMVVTSLPEDKSLVHVLVASNASHQQRIKASRAAEAFRILAEATQAGRQTA